MWTLGADRRVQPVSGQDDRVFREHEQEVVEGIDDRPEITAREFGCSWPSWEQRVTREQKRSALDMERNRSRCVPRIVNRSQAEAADFDHLVVIEKCVISHVAEHGGIELGDGNVIARLAQCGDCLDVIVVSMSLEDSSHSEGLAQIEKDLVFVGGVDENGVTCLPAPNNEDVVVEWADDDLVDFDARIAPMKCNSMLIST